MSKTFSFYMASWANPKGRTIEQEALGFAAYLRSEDFDTGTTVKEAVGENVNPAPLSVMKVTLEYVPLTGDE